LNLNRLLSLGRERQLIPADGEPNAAACAELIFSDGISTARAVTTISGRGMGMAAVRSYIQESGGSIKVEIKPQASFQDETVPFRLRLEFPLTLFSTKIEADRTLERSA
jgi:chemotaxis protein histidine kinase CheA